MVRIADDSKEFCPEFITLIVNIRKLVINERYIVYLTLLHELVEWQDANPDKTQESVPIVANLLPSIIQFLEGRQYPDICFTPGEGWQKRAGEVKRKKKESEEEGNLLRKDGVVYVDEALARTVNDALTSGVPNPCATTLLVGAVSNEVVHNAASSLFSCIQTTGAAVKGESGDPFEEMFFGGVLSVVLPQRTPHDYFQILRLDGHKKNNYYQIEGPNLSIMDTFTTAMVNPDLAWNSEKLPLFRGFGTRPQPATLPPAPLLNEDEVRKERRGDERRDGTDPTEHSKPRLGEIRLVQTRPCVTLIKC
ncbi:hypothetical protein PM082_022571 [Marasmius tenuissimus]|nr:hypothetical protein PM082_022571 [Marasmius tenuissimus]